MFTKRKFLNLEIKQQHKKCAEILKIAYETESIEAIEDYKTLLHWLKLPSVSLSNLKDIADAYHKHLQLTDFQLKEHNLLPSIKKGDKKTALTLFPLQIYLDQIRSGHNIGSIIRTTEAFSLGEIHFSKNSPLIDNKKVKDASMGSDIHVNCFSEAKLEDLTRPIIALETSHDAISLYDFIFPDRFTLVVGNEEYGCSDETLKLADYLIEIPLRGHKNSLNVANAFAIAASEIVRQKSKSY